MSVYHPDIVDFIKCKSVEGTLSNFNISVLIDKPFIDACKEDTTINLTFGDIIYKTVPAREIMSLICEHAWKNGEPGVIFIDRINEKHLCKHLGTIESTNPCGEQPLLPYESCTLGSINLNNMVRRENDMLRISDSKLEYTVKHAVRFLSNVIDINKYPVPEIDEVTKRSRKIGLGVMGWGTLLTRMNIAYGSKMSLELAQDIMRKISIFARETGIECGTYTTIAPTGTLATLAGVSYGIEPLFALAYKKEMVDKYFESTLCDEFEESMPDWADDAMYEDVRKRVIKTGSCQGVNGVPAAVQRVFRTCTEISPAEHIDMQAAFQLYTDNAVSKTINLPHDASPQDIEEAIYYAYERGCKGFTVYRKGSRESEPVIQGISEEQHSKIIPSKITPAVRPEVTYGFTERVLTGCGKMYVTVNSVNKQPFETFIEVGSSGGCEAFTECTSRLITMLLRSGVSPEKVVEQLRKVTCKNFIRRAAKDSAVKGKSCPDVIGRTLLKAMTTEPIEETTNIVRGYDGKEVMSIKTYSCPECGRELQSIEGCWTCTCGYSKC
jgi:ribonucleoside-diphosphate reductase alpha chain